MINIPCNRLNYGQKRNTNNIIAIVFHYTGNKTDTAQANGRYYQKVHLASAHYFVDRTEVVESVSPEFVAWSVGGAKYNNCSKTGGGTYYKFIKNTNSISVELCSNNGKIAVETQNNAIKLAKQLMKKYPSIKYIIRHFDVTGKMCPGWSGWIGDDSIWKSFKAKILDKVTNIDYSLVFNATYYLSKYPDLTAAGIKTEADALNHFIVCGMKEGRQAIGTFNVNIYKEKYKDLRDAFGENLVSYYMHYIQCGYNEGRKAI